MQMPEKIWVKATRGRGGLAGKRRVLFEGARARFITEQEPVEVPLSAYYLRRLSRGELERVTAPATVAQKTIAASGEHTED
jgi:hypothetical protein